MKTYVYQNKLIGKKELSQILGWSFSNFSTMQASTVADELKQLGFEYATKSGISISIEDLHVPFSKKFIMQKARNFCAMMEFASRNGELNDAERLQHSITTWENASDLLKDEIINYFENYDPLNSVYVMAFSGARGNISQVRQLIGMRGLMAKPNGDIVTIPIKKNFREGLDITDYLISGYGARKGIIDTALKTANSGYLTRRLIDVSQDIIIREKNCETIHSIKINIHKYDESQLIGRLLNRSIYDPVTLTKIASKNVQITPTLLKTFKKKHIETFYIRSPFTCELYRAICQHCYGWDLAKENLVEIGEAIGILAGQSIGEPGTQLTMRTFHTGGVGVGIKKEEKIIYDRKPLKAPISGLVKLSSNLKTVSVRTNLVTDLLLVKEYGSLIIIPDDKDDKIVRVELMPETLLCCSTNQYVKKDTVIAEFGFEDESEKKPKPEFKKPVLAYKAGEITLSPTCISVNSKTNHKRFWVLDGTFFVGPINSYLNFYSDYKINQESYVCRSKIINEKAGYILNHNKSKFLANCLLNITNQRYILENTKFFSLSKDIGNASSLLCFDNLRYLLYTVRKRNKMYLKLNRTNQIAHRYTSSYKTRMGGILYYDWNLLKYNDFESSHTHYVLDRGYHSRIHFRTIIWREKDTYKFDTQYDTLFVDHHDFITENFPIIPGRYSKSSGVVYIEKEEEIIKRIIIKSGLLYDGIDFEKHCEIETQNELNYDAKDKKTSRPLDIIPKFQYVYFPGEQLYGHISISAPSLCEFIAENRMLVSPLTLYEIPYQRYNKSFIGNSDQFKIKSATDFAYLPNQEVYSHRPINLAVDTLRLKVPNKLNNELYIEIRNRNDIDCTEFNISNKLHLTNHLVPELKYKRLQSCSLLQKNQFIDKYTTLLYVESVSQDSLDIVKIRTTFPKNNTKQILVIANEDCAVIEKNEWPNSKVDDFIVSPKNPDHIGKIIYEMDKTFIIHKGQPHIFHNANKNVLIPTKNLIYKFLPEKLRMKPIATKHNINLTVHNWFDTVTEYSSAKILTNLKNWKKTSKPVTLRVRLAKMIIEKDSHLYSSLIPRFCKNFHIKSKSFQGEFSESNFMNYDDRLVPKVIKNPKNYQRQKLQKIYRTLLLSASEVMSNNVISKRLMLVKFLEYPFAKTAKAVGLHSIHNKVGLKETNTLLLQSGQFLQSGQIMGFINSVKRTNDDITQGLPKIEQLFEARKAQPDKSYKLTQKTSINPKVNYQPLGTPVDKYQEINVHKLVKVYFNYFGFLKPFYCQQKQTVKYARLLNNLEAAYKSLKKAQGWILYSIQDIYKAQGVSINDKHIEVIIKQMTTKAIITDSADTPLLKNEVIDLYHIEQINNAVKKENKQQAYFIPLVFGITRAAMNNPSFLSVASFQETTRVLTKAAIEGRIDWLRGLKENIISGHLIPAGTGYRDYTHSFKKPRNKNLKFKTRHLT